MPLNLEKKSTAETLTVTVRREGAQKERDAEACAAPSVRAGGLFAKTAAGIGAVTSMIAYAHQMGNIVLNA